MSELQRFTPLQPLNTAVLFLVFNRLDTTRQVFQAIRQAKPPRLYIAADGPRADRPDETDKVQAVRDYVMENVDWECEVKTLFREENLGCKYAVSGAISWFFENEEQGIILEDDCFPSQSFFWFCEELLCRYKDDDSVYLISGDARASEKFISDKDYGFCKYPLIWGWASWSRAWRKYDPEMTDWPQFSENVLNNVGDRRATKRFWRDTLYSMYKKEIDTWDFQFSYLLLKNDAKCVVPRLNLISNVGFGPEATHTFNIDSLSSNRAIHEYAFPIKTDPDLSSENLINQFLDENEFSKNGIVVRIINKFTRIVFGVNVL